MMDFRHATEASPSFAGNLCFFNSLLHSLSYTPKLQVSLWQSFPDVPAPPLPLGEEPLMRFVKAPPQQPQPPGGSVPSSPGRGSDPPGASPASSLAQKLADEAPPPAEGTPEVAGQTPEVAGQTPEVATELPPPAGSAPEVESARTEGSSPQADALSLLGAELGVDSREVKRSPLTLCTYRLIVCLTRGG